MMNAAAVGWPVVVLLRKNSCTGPAVVGRRRARRTTMRQMVPALCCASFLLGFFNAVTPGREEVAVTHSLY